MQRDRDVPDRLMRMAHSCAEMGSPLYGALLARAVQEYRAGGPVKRVLDANAERSRLGLRLMAALHYLALSGDEELAAHYPSTGGDGDAGALWTVATDRFVRDAETIEALMDRTLQTNEPARAMPLMAGYCWLAARFDLPMRVFEIGASAGINLRWDGFAYDGGTWTYGAPSSLVLRNAISAGTPAHLNAIPVVAERRGCDLHPLDATSSVDRMELLSFVWPDQAERVERLRAALLVAASMPVEVDRADLLDWIPHHANPQDGALTVVVESVLVEHLAVDTRRALTDAVHAQGAKATVAAPFAWLRMEPKDGAYATEIVTWPDHRPDGVRIATSDGHAQNIVWSGA
jgi:hypothetical protein